MSLYFIALILSLAIVLFTHKRHVVFYVVIVAGLAQDMIRKIDVNEEIFISLLSVSIFLISMFFFFIKRIDFQYKKIFEFDLKIKSILFIYIIYIIFSSIWAYIKSQNIYIPFIGFFSYLLPLFVVWYVFEVVEHSGIIKRIMYFYLLVNIFAGVSIFIDWQNFIDTNFLLFKEIGEGVPIYDEQLGDYLKAYNGFYRTPEIAAWHMGVATSIAIVILFNTRSIVLRNFCIVSSLFLPYLRR